MNVRLIIAARATAGAMLLAVTVAACTGGSPSSTAPSIFTPSPGTSATGSSTAVKTPSVGQGGGATTKGSPTAKASASGKATAKPSDKPTAKASASASASASGKATAKPSDKPTAKASTTPKAASTGHHPSATHAPTPVPSATQFPNGAPETGGGGTAGLQDGLLFGIGGAVIVAGLGSLTYRRRLRRKFRPGAPDHTSDTPTHTGVR